MADLKTTNIYGDAYINNKVGIATNAPATRLQIGQLSPTAATEGIQFGDDTGARIYRDSSTVIKVSGGFQSTSYIYAGNYLQTAGNLIYPSSQAATQRLEVGNAANNAWIDGLTIAPGGNVVIAGNLSVASGTITSNYGTFAAPGLIIGDAQYGFYVSGGNVYYKSASGGVHYWRNIANSANVLSLDNSGNLVASGNISGANLSGTNTGDQSIGNGTITIAASTGVSVGATNTFTTNQSGATTVTITNTGVTALTTNTGLSTNASATGAVTITNTGVTNISAGTGIGTSASTGAVTITNNGVTSALAGTGVGVSGATGAVTFSIGQAVGTANSPTFVAVTTSNDGANLIMAGSANAEGIRMTPASSTTYPVFLRSVNPGVGEASPWIYKEQATDWGIWHNNPVNTIDFTKAGSGGIVSNVGGSANNTVVVRVDMGVGYVQTIAGYRNSAGTTILDNSGNITGNAATVTNGIYTTSVIYIGTTAITMSRSSAAQTLTGVSIDGTASNITAYTINQSVGTSNSPTFATLQLTRLNFGADNAQPWTVGAGGTAGTGLTFGGDYTSSQAYKIFTAMENVGGNYSKLTLNWHTGIRIGAYYAYGGTRFYNNLVGEGTEIFSVGNLDSNVRVVNSLIVNGITINQERATNARMYGATTGAFGLLGLDSAGSFRWQVYGEGSNYGFLNGAWAGWDIQKTVSGNLYLNGNGTYYLNPGSLTNLLSLTVANTITGAVSGNAGTVTNGFYTTGGQTIAGITYFSNGESINAYGIRGRFTNEYLHLYNKVGIGHPGGWGQGETSTPTQGLSTYGGLNIAYGDNGLSTFNGVIRANSNIRQGADLAMPLSSWSVSGTSTGMVIFSFPGNTGNYGMVHCVFDIYEYNSNTVSTVIVGGHNWNGAWYNFGANVIGRCGKSVRLGVKDSKYCVVFGGAASSWDYGTIILRKIHNGGFYTGIMDMGGSFTTQQTITESFSNISGDLRALRTSADFIADGGISGTTGTFSGELNIAGNYQIRNTIPTITFRDTDHRTGFIHVNSNIFYILTGVADSGYGNWTQVANSRWPLELNLSTNNAVFGGIVDAISFTGAGTGLTGTAASLNIGGNANNITQYTVNQSVGTSNTPTFSELTLSGQGMGAYGFMKYSGLRSGDWQTFTTTEGQLNVIQVNNITGGGHTNYPTGVYGYGAVMSWKTTNHSFQLYAAHTGDLAYKTQWQNDNYSGWRRILDSTNYPYAANMNQYVRTTDTCSFAALTVSNTINGSVTGNAGGSSTSCTGNAATATGQQSGVHFTLNTGGAGYGLVGIYDPDKHQGLFAMGSSYTLGAGGTLANFYGVSWSYDYAGRQLNTGYNLQHCMAVANAGVVATVIGLGIWTNGLIRANGAISSAGTITAAAFSGAGTSLTGTATSLSIGGAAASATFLNSSNYIQRIGGSGNYNTDFQNTPAGSVRHQGDDATSTNNPGGTWWFVDNYRHSNGSNYWGTQVAWGWEDQANRLATRNVTGGTFGGWVYYLNSANYNSYSPTLTGTGASGTWSINVTGNAGGSAASCTGNAATATNATQFGSEANTNFMRGLAGGTQANLDTYTDNGFRSIAYTGYSRNLLSFNPGGSTGTVQHEYYYNIPSSGWRVRNKTDNTTWSAWGNVVMTDTNQGALTGTIITTNSNTTVSGLNIGGNAVTAGGLSVHGGTNNEANKIVRTDGNGYIQAGWINTPSGDMPDTQSINRIYCSDDQYIRYKGVADFKQQLSLTYKYATPRSSYTTDTNYWTGMMGWGTTDFNTMITWGCGFIDSWTSPGNSPGAGYSHFVGVQALHYTNGDTDGTDNYGYQLVAGGGVNSPLFLRVNWGSAGSWKTMLDSLNFNSYSPSLTGNGASGTWAINITGNAATATTATNVTIANGSVTLAKIENITAYTILGNSNASATATPAALSVATVATMLSGQTMNINGSSTSISGFNNPTTAASGNTIVYRDGSGHITGNYIFGSYLNSTDNVDTGTITNIVAKFGDNYHRSATAAKVAAFITGQTMNINGSSTSCSGNAATATNVAASGITGQTGMWTSAARPGPYRLYRRDSDDDYSVQNYWTGVYWRLDGYYSNNTLHAGCSVSYADTAGALNTNNNYRVTNFGIDTAPSNKLHINGDNVNPTIRVDNGAVVLAASAASNSKSFYGWLPISITGTTKWIQMYN